MELRPLSSLADGEAILRVMIATWGEHQLVPREMLRALADSGNVPYGAFAGEELVGYVLGWAGVDDRDGMHVHSHMLATLPQRRHAGVGYALKLAQRAQALDQGLRVVRWTFDPLVARNAYFNLHKLGAVADRFERDFYGDMTDALNRGHRSDRFFARWAVEDSPGPRSVAIPGDATVLRRGAGEHPERVGDVGDGVAVVEIPPDHASVLSSDSGLASEWRDPVAEAVEACLSRGLVAVDFDRDRCAYLFGGSPGLAARTET